MIRRLTLLAAASLLTLVACRPAAEAPPAEPAPAGPVASSLIDNVIVIDGSGAAGRPGAVRIEGGLILEVGELQPLPGEAVVDGGGLVLAPGFIDTHSHADRDLFDLPGAAAAVSQGITTAVLGQDGGSPFPLRDFRERLAEQPAAINVAAYSGHNTLRDRVMGEDFRRPAREGEVHEMGLLLQEDLDAGALGLAAGLEYDPGIYSETSEMIALARIAAAAGGRYISHVRSEDRRFEQALDEILAIGQAANIPVQISHMKLAMTPLWGRAQEILARLDAARAAGVEVTADVYPYTYWQSNMMVLLPERDITDREEVEHMLREIAPPDGMWFTQYDPQPEYVGKTLTEVAALRGTDAATAFMELIAAAEAMNAENPEGVDTIIGTSMHPDDVAALIAWPHSNICSDGMLVDRHPRGAGAFTRILAHYVRETGLLKLEEAVRKMSALAADHMGFSDRGRIAPGLAADLVLFDPATVSDHATPQDPGALSTGVAAVWVNGEQVWDGAAETGARPGRFLVR